MDEDKLAPIPVQKRPSLVFKEGEIQKAASSSLDRAPKPVLDSRTDHTIIGSEKDTWNTLNTSILVSVSDDDDKEAKSKRRSKRSPNRDDSDDSDEDNAKKSQQSDDSYHIESDVLYQSNGFSYGFAEDRNKRFRRTMEDAHCVNTKFNDTLGSALFAVFDGHAGRATADYCQHNYEKILIRLLSDGPLKSVPEILNDSFLEIDKGLASKKGLHSGCTAVVAFTRFETRDGKVQRVLYTANVGDARVVLCRNGTAVRLSYDHKGSDAAEARRVVAAGGFMVNNRVNGVLAVTRSLGDLSMKEWVIGSAYTTETILDENDTRLIVACDGIWDVCPDQEAVDLIKDINDPQEASDVLVDFALDNRSTDNLTAIVVHINHDSKFTNGVIN